jgi:hypothetical protein
VRLLQSARSLSCAFDTGTMAFLGALQPQSVPDALPGSFVFDDIDRRAGRARLIITGGIAAHGSAADVAVIQGASSETLSFLERAPLGDGLYTVFATFQKVPGRDPTRLLALSYGYATIPGPNVGVYYGSCHVLE